MMFDDSITISNCSFAYKCQMQWENLYETENENIKFCKDCQKEVHYCETDEELLEAIKRNKCVSILAPFSNNLTIRETGMVDFVSINKD